MPRFGFSQRWVPTSSDVENLKKIFFCDLTVIQTQELVSRINHLLSDFEVLRAAAKRGKRRDRIRVLKSSITTFKKLKATDSSEELNELLEWKKQELVKTLNARDRVRGIEDQWPCYYLKEKMFKLYDSYHPEIVAKIIKSHNGARVIKKQDEVEYHFRKTVFVTLHDQTGYNEKIKIVSAQELTLKGEHSKFSSLSSYEDARHHTFGLLKVPDTQLSKCRSGFKKYVPLNTIFS